MNPLTSFGDITHVIQLAVAPVFLLSGIGALLSVMAGRLGRIIDRARKLEEDWGGFDSDRRDEATLELGALRKRAHLANWAINACAATALLICVVIAALFFDAFLGTRLKLMVGWLFILSMAALIAGLVCFISEVYAATHSLRIGPPGSAIGGVEALPNGGCVGPCGRDTLGR